MHIRMHRAGVAAWTTAQEDYIASTWWAGVPLDLGGITPSPVDAGGTAPSPPLLYPSTGTSISPPSNA